MIYIIIPVFNRIEFTKKCIESLFNQTYKKFKVVIIDDGSSDGTNEFIKNNYPAIHLIKGDGNLWWTASINLGVKYALNNKADYVLTLNNDTIAAPDFLEKIIYFTKVHPDALFGAIAYNAINGTAIYGGHMIDWRNASTIELLPLNLKKIDNGLVKVSHYPGRGLLIPRKVFDSIGLYDEKKMPQNGADDDFTLRAKKQGFDIFCNYTAKLYIYPNESKKKQFLTNKNFKNFFNHFFSKNGGENLVVFILIGMRFCPKKYLLKYIFFGTFKRLVKYFFYKSLFEKY